MNSILKKNLAVLREKIPLLATLATADSPSPFSYHVETAKNGQKTLAVTAEGKSYQIHSKYDPQKEAIQQIKGKNFRNPRLMIILGLGLIYHIRAALELLEKENRHIVIIERDSKAFQVAVQHVDMTDLFQSPKIRWIIDAELDSAFTICQDLIKSAGISLQVNLKTLVVFEHPVLGKIHGAYQHHLLKSFREAAETIITTYGNCPNDSLIGINNILANLSTIIRNPGVQDLYGAFKGVPGIVVSTGPTLDKNIQFLKGVEGKCVMAAADSAVIPLLKNGITPHMFASLERILLTVSTYKDVPEDKMKEIWMAATPMIRPEGYQTWKGPTFMVYRDLSHFEWLKIPKGTLNIGPSCSNMAFKILEAFGCDPIILVGQDCSFPSIDHTHAAGSVKELKLSKLVTPEMLFKIKGNYDEFVFTYWVFELFRKTFAWDIANFRGTCINSTAGGAFIEGAKLMPLDEAVEKFCRKPVDTLKILSEKVKYPTPEAIRQTWENLNQRIKQTLKELEIFIKYCDENYQELLKFEEELQSLGYKEIDDFLKRYPDDKLDQFYIKTQTERARIGSFGECFNQYIMHIIQMIVMRFEMDYNELPSLCDDIKRCRLQALRITNKWFPTIGDICRISMKALQDSHQSLLKEFGDA